MPLRPPTRPLPVLASALAAIGLVLAVASCSGHISPLNADPAPPSMPPARQLGSPIIMQVMRSQPPTPTGGCPAGWLEVYLPPNITLHAHPVGPGSASAPAPLAPTAPGPFLLLPCYQPVGTPATITFAAVSSVFAYPPSRDQRKAPAQYGFTVGVPAADVAAVHALITQADNSGDALGISVAGRLWEAPQVAQPFSGQPVTIAVLSRNHALQLYRLLVPSA
jgi:hypothetical protein